MSEGEARRYRWWCRNCRTAKWRASFHYGPHRCTRHGYIVDAGACG